MIRLRDATHLIAFVAMMFLICLPGSGSATVLLFDQSRDGMGNVIPLFNGQSVQQDYGDRVTGSPMAVPGGAFTYGNNGEGFTPNVLVDYSAGNNANAVSTWGSQYGDLTSVIFGGQSSQSLLVNLSADPGFEVLLYHFDLGGWPNTDYTINSVEVSSNSVPLFTLSHVLVEGDSNGPGHTSFDFSTPLQGRSC